MRIRNAAGLLAVGASLTMVLAGCGGSDGSGTGGTSGAAPAPPQTLTVFAAASLTSTFQEMEKRFETDNPGTDVKLNFAGSSTLATQIDQGAPADVFASADKNNMQKVVQAGNNAAPPVTFATNTLQIAVAPGNPKAISSLADLTKPGVRTVVCAPQVPCGTATQKVATAAGVTLTPVSEEQDVKSVLNKVITGNADAGLVYVTDVNDAGGKVDGVPFPQADQAVNTYPIAVLKNAQNKDLAEKWVQLVTGEAGKKILQAAGFGTP